MIEANHNQGPDYKDLLIAQGQIPVPGLRPDICDKNGEIVVRGNLRELSQEVSRIVAKTPWYRQLLKEVRQNKKSAIFFGVAGGLTIIAATAAGFEFGKRGGQDLRILPEILRRKR